MSRISTTPTTSPLLYHWGKDFQAWLFIILSLTLFRGVLITAFRQQSESLTLSNLLNVLGTGFRFDIAVAAVWVLPTILLALLLPLLKRERLLQKLRQWWLQLYIVLVIPLLGADLVFFNEFGDQFNMRIFGIIHDDTEAILITIWKEYSPIPFLLISGFIIWGASHLGRRWLGYEINWRRLFMRPLSEKWAIRFAIGVVCFIFMIAMMRGGLLWGEPIRLKHAFVTDDLFLNRTVVNPISSLRFTINEKMELDSDRGLSRLWPSDDIQDAATTVYNHRHGRTTAPVRFNNLDALLQQTTTGKINKPAKHIFLLLLESHSGWTVMPQYRELGFSPQLGVIASKGIYFPNFLASGVGTIPTVNSIFSGMPEIGLNTNYEIESLKPYPTGIATLMKQLGYKTRLFYGGYLGWERLDQFAPNQGFDELHGGGKMSLGGKETNEWGVDDKHLFDYIMDSIDPDIPSFNFILTTTNHPPFDIDLEAAGFPISKIPAELKATKKGTLPRLGHLWYADQQAGGFINRAQDKFDDSLFAITGDHTARAQLRFPGNNLLEPTAVPLIIYGPDLIDKQSRTVKSGGSHIDIAPTLVNMVAPAGHKFSSFGIDMLQKGGDDYGLGAGNIIGSTFLKGDNPAAKINNIEDAEEAPNPTSVARAQDYFQALKALSWWRIKRGAQLPQQ